MAIFWCYCPFIITLFPTAISESQYNIPDWVKNLGGMYFDDAIDSATFGVALEWLISNEIITVTISESSTTNSASYHTFSNSTGAYLTNSTGTFVVLERTIPTGFSSHHTFSNSTGAYLTNSTGTFVVLERTIPTGFHHITHSLIPQVHTLPIPQELL